MFLSWHQGLKRKSLLLFCILLYIKFSSLEGQVNLYFPFKFIIEITGTLALWQGSSTFEILYPHSLWKIVENISVWKTIYSISGTTRVYREVFLIDSVLALLRPVAKAGHWSPIYKNFRPPSPATPLTPWQAESLKPKYVLVRVSRGIFHLDFETLCKVSCYEEYCTFRHIFGK